MVDETKKPVTEEKTVELSFDELVEKAIKEGTLIEVPELKINFVEHLVNEKGEVNIKINLDKAVPNYLAVDKEKGIYRRDLSKNVYVSGITFAMAFRNSPKCCNYSEKLLNNPEAINSFLKGGSIKLLYAEVKKDEMYLSPLHPNRTPDKVKHDNIYYEIINIAPDKQTDQMLNEKRMEKLSDFLFG